MANKMLIRGFYGFKTSLYIIVGIKNGLSIERPFIIHNTVKFKL